ncbi:MAG: CvpA family protein [Thermomicrobiales bacterium]
MTALALTVLLAILWVALVGFGYWHGGWRQVILLAAMLLSYAVLSEWAAPNGRDLSTRFHWSVTRTTTGVALFYLLIGTFLLGFLGSFALYRPRPLDPNERRLGATMGVLNGGLLLALSLRTLRSFAFVAGGGQTLQSSRLSRFLIEDVGYLLLAALAIGGIAAVIGLVIARRDDARELALLDSVATPVVARPAAPPYPEQPLVPTQPAPLPPVSPPSPTVEPVYTTAPFIDWPASPPPGTQTTPSAAAAPPPDVPPVVAQEFDTPHARSPLPTHPQLPPRVPPPMIYPVADLIAAQAKPAFPVAETPSALPPPLTPPATPDAPRPPRPVGPPPGATHPAFVPPTTFRSSSLPPSPPPVVRELNPPTEEPPPIIRELDVVTHDPPPPVVRELDVTTHDEALPGKDEGMTSNETPARERVPPMPPTVRATGAIPAALPPPLPPVPAPTTAPPAPVERPAPTDEATKARTGFARVAVARQAGGRPDGPASAQSQSQPPAPPEPLHPPLPSGPRVHQCPTCGYPVRDHARYCPNCGSRQRP